MFRLRTIRTTTPSLSRCALRAPRAPLGRAIHYAKNKDDVTVQRVMFQSQLFTWRRAITPLVYAGTAYLVLTVLATSLLQDDDEELDERSTESAGNRKAQQFEEEEEEWDEEDTWFIPLGLWATERPREFYRGSDPEWQEFARFSKDSNRHQRAREQLVSIMRKHIASNPRFKPVIGNVDVTKGKYWLDIIFPHGPPLEYERSGIEIAPGSISWTTRIVTSRNYQRFNKIVWPHAAFFGMYQSGKLVFQAQYNHIREVLGLSDQADENPPTVQDALRKLAAPPTDSSDSAKRTASSSSPKVSQSRSSEAASPHEKNLGRIEFLSNAIDSTTLNEFMSTFTRRWKGFNMEPPRGSVVLKGLVGVQGDRGRMTLLVTGFYDPKSDKFVGLGAQLSSVQPRHQRPKGGP